MLVSWWNQCQSISQWETPPWESCSKLPLQSFVSPPPKSFYRSRSKECDTSVSLIIVSLDHAGRAGFSWCAHGKKRSWMRPFVTILHVRLSDFILFIIHWYIDTPSPKMAGFSNAASNPKVCRADIFTVFWYGGWWVWDWGGAGRRRHRAAGIILPLSRPPQNLKTIHLYFWRSTTSLLLTHCCLAPCKCVTNYGTLTEPKSYYVEIDRTQISNSNGHISETKKGTG